MKFKDHMNKLKILHYFKISIIGEPILLLLLFEGYQIFLILTIFGKQFEDIPTILIYRFVWEVQDWRIQYQFRSTEI